MRTIMAAAFAFGLFLSPAFGQQTQKAPQQTRSCTDERRACEVRCGTTHGYTGDKLASCKRVSCAAGWAHCMDSGFWVIGKTGQKIGPLTKK